MSHKVTFFIINGLILLMLAGCGLFGSDEEPPAEPVEAPPEEVVVTLPTPTPLPVEPPLGEDMVSLLNEPGQVLDEAPVEAAPQAVQMPRFSAGPYSFVPPAGWEVVDLDQDVLLVRRSGDDLFTGPQNRLPYVYLRTTPVATTATTSALLDRLDQDILANLAGVQTTEPPQGVIIDGTRGVWQFAEGVGDSGRFRAYLMAIPVGSNATLHTVVWGPVDAWGSAAPEMAKVLETMRFRQ